MKLNRYRAVVSENIVNYGLLAAAFVVMALLIALSLAD